MKSLTVTRDRLNDVLKAVGGLTKKEVLIGIPDSAPEREDGPMSNAQIGYVQEFGSPAQNIPERPFLVTGIRSAQGDIAKRMESGISKVLKGDEGAGEQALNTAGLIAQNAVQTKIESGPFSPLSEVTLQRRRARGRTGTKPLIDTGQLRNSITYVIRQKGK